MSIEEKAKAYDEALKRAKEMCSMPTDKATMEYIFPELHESEDEKIRKALIDALKVSETIGELKFRLPYPTREECIAYLKKQKEPTTEELYAEAGTTEKEYIANTMKMVRAMREKQKEQKPEDKEITLTNFEEVLNTFLFDFANSPIEDCEPKEYTKKHSAEILKAAYTELNAQLKQDIFEAQQEGRREGYEAAKAEQMPADWSEEDKDTIENAIKYLNRYSGALYNGNKGKESKKVSRVAKNLKSLRPSWKPSEEQMEVFQNTMQRLLRAGGTGKWYAILESLYEQLKKL